MIKIGQKVRFIPLKGIRVFGLANDDDEKTGVITYINVPHKWFLVEYEGFDCKLYSGYKFCDIGDTVFIGDGPIAQLSEESDNKVYTKNYERSMSLADYVACKIGIMCELGVKPTDKEIDHLISLDSEIKVDTAVKTILKKHWEQRNYK